MNAALETPVEPAVVSVPSPIALTSPARVSTAAGSSIAYTYKRFPLTIVRGDGVTLFDDAGNSYLDCMSGIATNALGYNDAGVNAAIVHRLGVVADRVGARDGQGSTEDGFRRTPRHAEGVRSCRMSTAELL